LTALPGIHRPTRVEAVGAQLVGEVDHGVDLVDVEARRREVDLDRHPRVAKVAHAVEDAIELAAHAHAAEGRKRGAIEAHLDRLDTEVLQSSGIRSVEIVGIGLDLELRAALAGALDHGEEMRMEHRLAAGKR
jgi:UPF0288 family protein (methanogenesis marker protein 3)